MGLKLQKPREKQSCSRGLTNLAARAHPMIYRQDLILLQNHIQGNSSPRPRHPCGGVGATSFSLRTTRTFQRPQKRAQIEGIAFPPLIIGKLHQSVPKGTDGEHIYSISCDWPMRTNHLLIAVGDEFDFSSSGEDIVLLGKSERCSRFPLEYIRHRPDPAGGTRLLVVPVAEPPDNLDKIQLGGERLPRDWDCKE